jgi:hypothetical protein
MDFPPVARSNWSRTPNDAKPVQAKRRVSKMISEEGIRFEQPARIPAYSKSNNLVKSTQQPATYKP